MLVGNRVYKKSTASGSATEHKYIVDPQGILDITRNLPVILMEVNGSGGIVKTNIYGDRQILAQHDGDMSADKYFYLHDRLGSVRLILADNGSVVKCYTYEPFGEVTEDDGTFDNAFMFTGQYYDSEINEYYLRARQYNPGIARFTSRDPARGKFRKPTTLHKYFYSENDPINKIDPRGEVAIMLGGSISGNVTATDYAFAFENRGGLSGIGALVAHSSVILPSMVYFSDHFGTGLSGGAAGFVAAWDHTMSFNDRDAWSWGSMQWLSGGASWNSGMGGSITLDIGISNARHVSELSGRFVEAGGSFVWGNGFTFGGTVARGVNPDNSFNDIWLGTVNFGGGTPGWEGHVYVGNAWVQEYEF